MQVNQEGICSRVVGLHLSVLRSLLLEMLLFFLGILSLALSLNIYVCECICMMCVRKCVCEMCAILNCPLWVSVSLVAKKSRWSVIQFLSHKRISLLALHPVRGENGELRVGVRRAMRQASNIPSSIMPSHSMHIGVLATAWHAISTGTMFTVYYKPRYAVELSVLGICRL